VTDTSVSWRNDLVGENTGEGEKHSLSDTQDPATLAAGSIYR